MEFDFHYVIYKCCGFFPQWLIFTIFFFVIMVSIIITSLSFSIDGLIDIKGIVVELNGFNEWKALYILNIVIDVVLLLLMVLLLLASSIAGYYLKLREYINTRIGFIPSYILLAVIFVISFVAGILSLSLYSSGTLNNNIVEGWNVESIQHVESHYECCFGVKGKGARALCLCDIELDLVSTEKFKNVTYDITQIIGNNNTYVDSGKREICGECKEEFNSKNKTNIFLLIGFDVAIIACSVVLFGIYLFLLVTTYVLHDRD